MTCIVAISDGKKVYMGGERGHSDSHIITSSTRPKIFERGSYLIGYAGNTGIGQAVVHNFEFPAIGKTLDPEKHMTRVFIPALRTFIKDQDIKLPENEDDNASFLVGIKGRVYEIDMTDFQCVEYTEVSIGSGSGYAYGSLHTTEGYDLSPIDRIHIALDAAITYSPTCQGPIDYLEK
jgi:20S proteasome alpha/beta subunit